MKVSILFQQNRVKTYRREILLILVVKLILVVAIKFAFFSNPVSKTLTAKTVSETIIGVNPKPSLSTSTSHK